MLSQFNNFVRNHQSELILSINDKIKLYSQHILNHDFEDFFINIIHDKNQQSQTFLTFHDLSLLQLMKKHNQPFSLENKVGYDYIFNNIQIEAKMTTATTRLNGSIDSNLIFYTNFCNNANNISYNSGDNFTTCEKSPYLYLFRYKIVASAIKYLFIATVNTNELLSGWKVKSNKSSSATLKIINEDIDKLSILCSYNCFAAQNKKYIGIFENI